MTLTLPVEFKQWLAKRRSTRCHRQLVVIHGDREWAEACAQKVVQESHLSTVTSIGLSIPTQETLSVTNKSYRQYLGQEFDLLVYNAFEGIRANALMGLSGAVKAQGLMVLVCPDLEHWPKFDDPEIQQRTSYGFDQGDKSNFIQWLVMQISRHSVVAKLSEQGFTGNVAIADSPQLNIEAPYASEQQMRAVEGVVKVLTGHRKRPFVITADRGRGKSSCLGIAAGILAKQRKSLRILVTAPRFSSVEKVFQHAKAVYPELTWKTKQVLSSTNAHIGFEPTDAILEGLIEADLLFIDEAAAIPNETLTQLVNRYSRVVFSTTIHGYEGSGRGFEVRFKRYLEENYPGWKSLHIDTPVRWYRGDVLEQFWFDTMLMTNHKQHSITEKAPAPEQMIYKVVHPDELLASPEQLSQLFELLVDAHYQTEQDDLARLLDAQDMSILVGCFGEQVASVALLSEEGGQRLLPLNKEVSEGVRRPNGHLVAQSLAYHFVSPDLANSSYLRVVRIAVLPSWQNQGLGSEMLKQVEKFARSKNADFVATSFGLTQSLLAFWRGNEYVTVKVGYRKDTSSGEHNTIMLTALSSGAKEQVRDMSREFSEELIFQCPRKLNALPPQVILSLLANCDVFPSHFSEKEHAQLIQFAENKRPVYSCGRSLFNFAIKAAITLGKNKRCENELQLLVCAVLQQRPMEELTKQFSLTGKKQLESALRNAVKDLMKDLD